MLDLYGTTYVAAYLGVTNQGLLLWVRSSELRMPGPDVRIKGALERTSGYAWSAESLAKLRPWLERHRGYSRRQADEYWAKVDAKRRAEIGEAASGRRSDH